MKLDATQKKKLRDAVQLPASREQIVKLAKTTQEQLDGQDAHIARLRNWLRDGEATRDELAEQALFLQEILSEFRA
jgi:hypothetical protein